MEGANMEKHLEWHDLMKKENKTPEERVLIQCIASLSSHPTYWRVTPEDIYEQQIEFAEGLYK